MPQRVTDRGAWLLVPWSKDKCRRPLRAHSWEGRAYLLSVYGNPANNPNAAASPDSAGMQTPTAGSPSLPVGEG